MCVHIRGSDSEEEQLFAIVGHTTMAQAGTFHRIHRSNFATLNTRSFFLNKLSEVLEIALFLYLFQLFSRTSWKVLSQSLRQGEVFAATFDSNSDCEKVGRKYRWKKMNKEMRYKIHKLFSKSEILIGPRLCAKRFVGSV